MLILIAAGLQIRPNKGRIANPPEQNKSPNKNKTKSPNKTKNR